MKHDILEHSANHFECRNCHGVWQNYPNPCRIFAAQCHGIMVSKHDLIKNGANQFECRACGQTWQTKPRSKCPGVKLYLKYGHEPLLTKLQLGYAGYEISKARLPTAVGCFQSSSRYILLYDPAQAVKKHHQARPRKTITITELFWPLDGVGLIEAYIRRKAQDNWFALETEIGDIAYYFSLFTASEIEHMGKGVLHLKIAPCLLHPSLAAFQRSSSARIILIRSVVAAYESQKALRC